MLFLIYVFNWFSTDFWQQWIIISVDFFHSFLSPFRLLI